MRYAAIAKPGIAAGVGFAGMAGMVLAGHGLPDVRTGATCLFCILAAAAGSAIFNVVLERRTDAMMPRVEGRLRALNTIGAANAAVLAAALVLVSLSVSLARLNVVSTGLILAATVSYTLLYTVYLKRRSPYGTVTGGIPGALPVLIGYSAVSPRPGLDGLILFAVMLLWQPPHFLALALKYRGEYRAAGLPVMPVALGEGYSKVFALLYATALVPLALSLYILGYCSAYYGWFALAAGLAFVISYFTDMKRGNFGRAFLATILYMMGILGAVVVDAGFITPN